MKEAEEEEEDAALGISKRCIRSCGVTFNGCVARNSKLPMDRWSRVVVNPSGIGTEAVLLEMFIRM